MNNFKALNKEYEQINCDIIATFYVNNKNYMFYRDDKGEIYAAFIDGNDIKQIINNEEFEMVNQVFNELKKPEITIPDFTDLGTSFYKGNEYKTIYDALEDRHYFYEYKENKFREADEEIRKYFDNIYNRDIEVMYSNEDNNKFSENKYVKRFIKVGRLLIVVVIVANFSFTAIKTVDLNKGFTQNVTSIMEIYKVDEQEASNILSYIEKNDRLPEKEKEFILSQEHFFKENEKYFEMSTIKKNLSNLKIKYDMNNQDVYKMSPRVKGFYKRITDQIVIFYADELNNDPVTQKVLFHEVMHAISNNGYVSKGTLGLSLTEGINELVSEEYLNTYSDTYNKGQTYARIMCELVGPETVKESFFKGNINILLKSLESICGTEKDAKKFIALLDTEARADVDLLINESSEKVRDAKMTLAKIQPQIDMYLRVYYESKFNQSYDNDKLMLAYMDSIRLTNNLENDFYQEGNMEKINVVKHYLNSELVNKDKSVRVEYIYMNNVEKQINRFEVKKTEDGKFRRIFSNGQYIDYDKDPTVVSYKSANYAFQEDNRLIEKGRTI